MPASNAEQEYMFRHGLMRDAAYQLTLPGNRARLHREALYLIHQMVPAEDRPAVAAMQVEHAAHALKLGDDEELTSLQNQYLRLAATHAGATYDIKAACGFLRTYLDHPLTPHADRLDASLQLGDALLSLGRGDEAAQILRNALAACTADDRRQRGRLHAGLGGILIETGQPDKAAVELEEAIKIHRDENDLRYLGMALTNRAVLHRHAGLGEDPRGMLEEALKIHRATGNELSEGKTLQSLAGLYRDNNNNDRAERTYREALAIYEKRGALVEVARTWGNLANTYLVTDRHAQSEAAYLRALKALREKGALRSVGIVLGNLGNLFWKTGRLMQSIAVTRESIALLGQTGDRMLAAVFRADQSGRMRQLGHIEQARQMIEQSYDEAHDIPGSIAMHSYVLPGLFLLHMARACGVYGPGHDPAARDPGALNNAEDAIRLMRNAESNLGPDRTISLSRQVSACLKTLTRSRRAIESGKETLLYNGSNVDGLSSATRLALLAHLKENAPAEYGHLTTRRTVLASLMRADTDGLPEPDWRCDAVPE